MVHRYKSPEHAAGARLAIATFSDAGPASGVNEDSLAVHFTDLNDPHGGTLLVVADGLGGHNAGEVASGIVTGHFPGFFFSNGARNRIEAMQDALKQTNLMLHKAGFASDSLSGMGSTIVAGLITRRYFISVNVGDSRAYLFRNGARMFRTTDDSLAHELPGIGPRRGELSHVLTQALGVQQHVTPHVNIIRVEPEDIFLLCTDGITDVLSEDEIGEIIRGQDTHQCVRALVAAATTNGSLDDMSVIAGRILQRDQEDEPSTTMDNQGQNHIAPVPER